MLQISFFGKFYSFYKLFMPKLLSQSKHEEFEPNSALQIIDHKERRAEKAKKLELQEILQGTKFSEPVKFSQAEMFILRNFHPVHYSCLLHTAHFSHIIPAARLMFCHFVHLFDFFPFCPCNS